MTDFKVKFRPKGENAVREDIVSAKHQTEARKKIESMYSGCKVVACTKA